MIHALGRTLIVGLGNPGPVHRRNRHNVGFQCMDALAQAHDLPFSSLEARARIARGTILGRRVILAKPISYMNDSGAVMRALVAHRVCVSPQNVLVVHDDLDLPLGKIRLRPGGSAGGHKGVQSIIDSLGTDRFSRLRVGIGRPPAGAEVVDYVLSDFSEDELAAVTSACDRAVAALETFLQSGIEEAMNQHN